MPCDSLPFLLLDKQVKPNDAYFFSGEDQRTYEFNFCDAYNSDVWDALILLYEYNSKNSGFGRLLKQVEGCSVQFKFDLTKDYPEYAIVIRDKHNCSRLSDVENGVMTFEIVNILMVIVMGFSITRIVMIPMHRSIQINLKFHLI